MEMKIEKNKHSTDLRGVCLIHNDVGVHKCKLVPDVNEMETVVQLSNPPFSQDLRPYDFCPVYFAEKISPDADIILKFLLAVPFFSVYRLCPNKSYFSAFKSWILKLETEFPSREDTPTN